MKTYWYFILFLLCLITTTISGAEWRFGKPFLFTDFALSWNELRQGFYFSIPFLSFLTFHEFGHYFTAKLKKISVTLPLYIPIWIPFISSIGTMGAFIRIKDRINNKIDYFDIGIAGPLSGFIVAVLVLIYGFSNLPQPEDFLFKIHPEYAKMGDDYNSYINSSTDPNYAVKFGHSILYDYLKNTFADPSLLPHPYEESHYSLLFAGFLGLFFTALNLLPIGQLDGGHILYALIGKRAFSIVSPIFFSLLVFYSGLGLFSMHEFHFSSSEDFLSLAAKFFLYCYFIYLCFSKLSDNKSLNLAVPLFIIVLQLFLKEIFPNINGYPGFLVFGFLIGRVLGVQHPPTFNDQPMTLGRIILGWISIIIFIICFSPNPLS